mmetsp:Transcript_9006/g.18392  ORF Transcript_9006/g.18392 Transcript_9006/m.18392 type:complete len:389 (+) Transcript_9006:303-1469(+)|eukprot:CAMPEP_0178706876 /NCGR_PEP_ID=MMETSP0699-20121125/15668_1 /TAXON_ID=265572 /ORGANISM="Extubocellulus spinifer, Strain CCMP396" /LENGTH=388 /DNA_ID=CAMNT_0020354761 /DNA_START=796 /DNA_END=1962 /DNA_ORIENTATION=+
MSDACIDNSDDRNDGAIILEDFSTPSQKWRSKNDPVMGGQSHATVVLEPEKGIAIFDGDVVDVPFLGAPGFVTMESYYDDDGSGDSGGSSGRGSGGSEAKKYPDVSTCQAMRLVLRSATIPYGGYRVSFGTRHVPGNRFAFGYKADLDLSSSSELPSPSLAGIGGSSRAEEAQESQESEEEVSRQAELITATIPFANFTVRWDDATGDAIVPCYKNTDYCPDLNTLRDMQTIKIWGEGVAGKVHLEIEQIAAVGCDCSDMDADMNDGGVNVGGGTFLIMLMAIGLFGAAAMVGAVVGSVFVRRRFNSTSSGRGGYTSIVGAGGDGDDVPTPTGSTGTCNTESETDAESNVEDVEDVDARKNYPGGIYAVADEENEVEKVGTSRRYADI